MNQGKAQQEPNTAYIEDIQKTEQSVSGSEATPGGEGGMQPQGGGSGLGGPERRLSPSKTQVVQVSQKTLQKVFSGEFKLTKRLLREQAEAYLASEGVLRSAQIMLDLLDSKSEKMRFAAAKDILDRAGAGKTKESITELLKTKLQGEVDTDWLERISDEEPKSEVEESEDKKKED